MPLHMKKKKTKGSVLVVEDDMLLSLVETRIIEKLGYSVVGKATSGEEAVDLVKDLKPQVVVMDVSLKGKLNGIDASNLIRQFSNVPVIFLSGNTDPASMKNAKSVGNTEYLVKPIIADDIVIPLKRAVKNGTGSGNKSRISEAS